MKGTNTLHLNEATIIEAVQEYLSKRVVGAAPTVESVTYNANYGNGVFVVVVKSEVSDEH